MTEQAAGPLAGVHVVEVGSFVAAPSAGLVLRQLGAEVVRIDPVGGAPDINRWPLNDHGHSLYWAGLNRGKQSAEIDLASIAGQERVQQLVTAPGPGRGILLTNLTGKAWLSDELLRATRPDLIHVQVLGTADGRSAVDYTVNAALGLAYATGPPTSSLPLNHTLPAWDLLCGQQAAVAILAGLHRREQTGEGTHATVALEDVATATLTTLGMLPEAQLTGTSRPPFGNSVYGSYGADLPTADDERVMVVALTGRQWNALLDVTETGHVVATVEAALGADFKREGDRWIHRDMLTALIRPWFASRTVPEIADALAGTHVLWSPFRRLAAVAQDLAGRTDQTMVGLREDRGLGTVLATDGAIRLTGAPPREPAAAPTLGQHTDAVLASLREASSSVPP